MQVTSRPPKRGAESPRTPQPSKLRRKTAEVFGDNLGAKMWKDEEEKHGLEPHLTHEGTEIGTVEEAPQTPGELPLASLEQEEDEYLMDNFPSLLRTAATGVPNTNVLSTPIRQTVSSTPPAQKGVNTLRRKTKDLFSGSACSSDAFDPDDYEYDQGSPSLRSSALRKKATNLFTGYRESKEAFDADASEFEDSSPLQAVKGRTLQSENSPPARQPKASASFTSSPMTMEVDDHGEAQSPTPSKQSTLRRQSAGLFGQKNFSSPSMWDAGDEEFTQKLGSVRLDSFGQIRSKPQQSQRTSLSSFKSSPPQFEQNVVSSKERLSSLQGTSLSLGTPSGSKPTQTTGASPLPIFFKSAKEGEDQFMVTHEGGPVRSMWDADDDEFDRWPDKRDLESALQSFVEHRGTFKGIPHIKSHRFKAEQDSTKSTKAIGGDKLTAQQREDYLHELPDRNCGNPRGIDAHDEVMKQFSQRRCAFLPVAGPSNHPHLLHYKSYLADDDHVVQAARPRLADAVATVLYQTSPKFLTDFLRPDIKVFEWRRDGNHVMIRRSGKEVIVGTFSNFGTTYLWPLFVRSRISDTGSWEEVYAGAAQIMTPVTAEGVDFEKFVPQEKIDDVDPEDEKYALYMGRLLGKFLLEWSVWDFREWRRWNVEWEADGLVVNAREHGYEALKMMLDVE